MKNLIKLRKDLKLTQAEVADKVGISQSGYSAYEKGKTYPEATILIKLADFFHVSTDLILERNYNGINFSALHDCHYKIIQKLENLNETQCEKLSSYIDGITNN